MSGPTPFEQSEVDPPEDFGNEHDEAGFAQEHTGRPGMEPEEETPNDYSGTRPASDERRS